MITLKWKINQQENQVDFKELLNIKYQNNLQILVIPTNSIIIDFKYIIPLIECIRNGLKVKKVYFVTFKGSVKTEIYL